jgi:2-methylcitrate dehydratase PrpD
MYDDDPRSSAILDGLGSRWAVLENGYKPYPCGIVAHAAIDAVLQLRAEVAPGDRLSALRLRVPPETARLMGNPAPRTGLEAKFSVRYAAAVAWIDGAVLPEAFEDPAVNGPAYREAMARIAVEVMPGLAQDEARVEAETASGSAPEVHVEHARGTAARPLTDDELQAKFLTACHIGGNGNGPQLLRAVEQLDRIPVTEITALLPGDGRLDAATTDEEAR